MKVSIETLKDYAALRKAIGGLQKSGENPHFKNTYVELNAVIDTVDDVLEKHNFITYLQPAMHRDGKNFLKTQLFHNSGEVIETELELITTKTDPQMMGSSITYMRRYGLMSILGLKAEDDDGNGGAGRVKPASDADFNQAKKRMEKAKFAHSFKTFIDQFQKEKAYNSAQVELLGQFYNQGFKKIEEEKAKAAEAKAKTEEKSEEATDKIAMDTETLNKTIDWMISEKQDPADVVNQVQVKYSLTPEQEAAILQKQKMKG